jgi:hypothetical protein
VGSDGSCVTEQALLTAIQSRRSAMTNTKDAPVRKVSKLWDANDVAGT